MSNGNDLSETMDCGDDLQTSCLLIHDEHTRWQNEDALWREEIGIWQTELQSALSNLHQITEALRAHEDALRSHASAIRCYEIEAASHEHALVEFERDASGPSLPMLAKRHLIETDKRLQQQRAHERLKKYQHTVIANCNLLLKSLAASSIE